MNSLVNRKMRFAVGTEKAVLSSFWFVTATDEGSVYVGARSLGGTLKASFHRSGSCHVRFGQRQELGTLANSYMMKWRRKPTPPAGAVQVGSIIFSTDLLRGQMDPPEGKAMHVLFVPPPKGHALELGLFYSHETSETMEAKFLKIGKPLIYSELPTGEVFSVVARTGLFDAEAIPQLRGLAKGGPQTYPGATWHSASLGPGSTMDNLAMLLFNDPEKDGVFIVWQVTGLRVTHNAAGS
jgi:hypothetical protein